MNKDENHECAAKDEAQKNEETVWDNKNKIMLPAQT